MNMYQSPNSDLGKLYAENNSGQGIDVYPDGVKGWSWGAFLLNWIWALFNRSYIGLLVLVPYIGFVFAFYLGFKGRQLAWKNKEWESLEHFNEVQRKWSVWGIAILLIPMILGIIAAVLIPAYQDYATVAH